MTGWVQVPVSKEVVGLVPKAAVRKRDDVSIVRVWDPETRLVGDRTVKTEGTQGEDVIVTAGVLAGESVVVPRETNRVR
jgi:hypothetical protein